ncbi:MAG: LamG-like jellyroll fold domain-containing protein, partial [Thiotrichaceae bacterium]
MNFDIRSATGRLLFFAMLFVFSGICRVPLVLAGTGSGIQIPSGIIPDLTWQPNPYVHNYGTKIRYIDFKNGDDRNPGSKLLPWKHHPWDTQATGTPKKALGIDTYIFKKGIVYRGTLVANDSGSVDQPIRLTTDLEWGSGEALLSGSMQIKNEWHRCNPQEASILPTSSQLLTWCTNWPQSDNPNLLWEIRDDIVHRIPIARYPNWSIADADDPRSQWQEISGAIQELRLSVENTQGFSIGDRIWQPPKNPLIGKNRKQPSFSGNITDIGHNYLLVDLIKWDLHKIKAGRVVSNGKSTTRVIDLPERHNSPSVRLISPELFRQQSTGRFRDATIWLESGSQVKPRAGKVIDSDPEEDSISVNIHLGPKNPDPYNRFYLEGLPIFLDSTGEYTYKKTKANSGTLYLRLPGDRNPNASKVEAANLRNILTIRDQHHIEISGLTFRFANQIPVHSKQARHAPLYSAAIQIRGSSSDIKIHHCRLLHLPVGIVAFPSDSGKNNVLDHINITDNEFRNIDGSAIVLGNGRGRMAWGKLRARLIHSQILRNRLTQIGSRPLGLWGAGANGHGIDINGGELIEIAGNHINLVWGAGIALTLGSDYKLSPINRPLLRGLIHHNKVVNSILGIQDIGGIGSWMGGPTYIYNNISGNPVGYKHAEYRTGKKTDWYRSSSYGIGIYLDGQYKGYVFNNIVWGLNNNVNDRIYNSVAINEAMGFMNTIFHNTLYRFGVGLHKGMFQHNRSYYIGNLMLDIGHRFIQHEARQDSIDQQTLAYSHNVFSGAPFQFGKFGTGRSSTHHTLNEWRKELVKNGLIAADTGKVAESPLVKDETTFDFRPNKGSSAIDAGAKVFVPWGLYRVVGEWNFLQMKQRPDIVNGENLNMNEEWIHRSMFQDIPRNNLSCSNIQVNNYVFGTLEDWTKGALKLNGENEYCMLDDSDQKKGYDWKQNLKNKSEHVTPKIRDTIDIRTENFLIEAVLATDAGHTNSGIVSKMSNRGYSLTIDDQGRVEFKLDFGEQSCSRVSSVSINDGQWHHVVAEADRSSPLGINIYVDGKLANGQWNGHMRHADSISNTANFDVGRTGNLYFAGRIDFLRIAKGTLEQAETDIDKLYEWEFDGPFLKDFSGKPPSGTRRDAGAVEYRSD